MTEWNEGRGKLRRILKRIQIEPIEPSEALLEAIGRGGKIRISGTPAADLASAISDKSSISFRWRVVEGSVEVDAISVIGPPAGPAAQPPARGRGHAARGTRPPAPTHTIDGIRADGTVDARGQGGSKSVVGVSDEVLAIRPGASVIDGGRAYSFGGYAPDVAHGLGTAPDVDRNPYGFAAWHGDAPWQADDYRAALHDADYKDRSSGVIRLTYEASTPIFIPSAEDQQSFFDCWDGESRRPAIPGSSLKGVVRTLTEILTNSRSGVSDEETLRDRRLYRRRASKLYRIVELPTEMGPGRVELLRFEFVDANHQRQPVMRHDHTLDLNQAEIDSDIATKEPWRANLYWVGSERYRHGDKAKIAYRSTGEEFELPLRVIEEYLGMLDHPQFTGHQANTVDASGRGSKGYGRQGAPPYDTVREKLFELKEGNLVFGIEANGVLVCFGKNVNFLWPSRKSPRELAEAFVARTPAESRLDGSDTAELLFGFIGNDSGDTGPFRGRVRFTPFWEQTDASPLGPLTLMPLTSPSGMKMKSRPLYLAPGAQGSATYSEADAALKGRKVYWHQRPHPDAEVDGLPLQHVARAGEREGLLLPGPGAPTIAENMSGPTIRPLPSGSRFGGEVHFTNLSDYELGALIVALAPHLALGDDAGIKIGKGKPRGLGSLRCHSLEVTRLAAAPARYASIAAEVDHRLDTAEVEAVVGAYRAGAEERARAAGSPADWDRLEFVQDLQKLLAIPEGPRVHVYPPTFSMYGWAPDWDEPDGDPQRHVGRPPGMKRSRDV